MYIIWLIFHTFFLQRSPIVPYRFVPHSLVRIQKESKKQGNNGRERICIHIHLFIPVTLFHLDKAWKQRWAIR